MNSLGLAARRDAHRNANTTQPLQLHEKIASVLPKKCAFDLYHLSTPPTQTCALYIAPPNERPDKTYCEKHFLAVSIDAPLHRSSIKRASPGVDAPNDASDTRPVLALGLEVFIFTTAFSTTIFISKADSTGYLNLLKIPPGTPSPIREICLAVVGYLVEHRRRTNVPTIVSLFARAQDQYLFPGSSKNKGKHVLSDYQLVKWWCRALNPLLEQRDARRETWRNVRAYLTVPGLDGIDARKMIPRTENAARDWTLGHPMEIISHYTHQYDWFPLRCLIPYFPDDPKSRFRDHLDQTDLSWKSGTGTWRHVKTLAQFWEMMAHRTECSGGRLTGFIWVVFDAKDETGGEQKQYPTPIPSSDRSPSSLFKPSTPSRQQSDSAATTVKSSPFKCSFTPASSASPCKYEPTKVPAKRKKKLTGPIVPRQPQIKTEQRNYLVGRPTTTKFYHWPEEGRGAKLVSESAYKRIVELLVHLDFSTLDKAITSTRRWTSEVGASWGRIIIGTRVAEQKPSSADLVGPVWKSSEEHVADSGPNLLDAGSVRRKSKGSEAVAAMEAPAARAATVDVLYAALPRKKARVG